MALFEKTPAGNVVTHLFPIHEDRVQVAQFAEPFADNFDVGFVAFD